jgi:diguanylate cyclase (GGDEF)-like protein
VRVVYALGATHEEARLSSTHPADGHGFVGRVLESGHAAVETIDHTHDRSLPLTASGAPVRYAVGAAVRPPGGPAGALCIGYSTPRLHRDRSLTLWMVERYAALASLCLYDAGVLEGLLAAARMDSLTGCPNHAAIRSTLHRELERSARNHRPLCCCFIDLDRFKQINDRYGHQHGSQVLAEVAAVLRAGIRLGDTLGRYGGDEFVAILPDTDQPAAASLAERLRSTISTTTLNGAHEPLGVSVGVAQARPGCTADELLTAADDALRIAKGAGGGLVVGASDVAAGAGRGVAAGVQAAGQ